MKITAKHILNCAFILMIITDVTMMYFKYIKDLNFPVTSLVILGVGTIGVGLIVLSINGMFKNK